MSQTHGRAVSPASFRAMRRPSQDKDFSGKRHHGSEWTGLCVDSRCFGTTFPRMLIYRLKWEMQRQNIWTCGGCLSQGDEEEGPAVIFHVQPPDKKHTRSSHMISRSSCLGGGRRMMGVLVIPWGNVNLPTSF